MTTCTSISPRVGGSIARCLCARSRSRVSGPLSGAPPPAPLKGPDTRDRERAHKHRAMEPPTRGEIDVQVVIPLPVDEVWRGVLDASTYTVDAAPGERGGVVPGTPVGQLGELRYVCLL